MHIASEELVGRLALAEGALLASRANDSDELVLIVKLPTDTLKRIHGGTSVNLVIGHVQIDQCMIRCVGLEICDCPEDTLVLSQPQSDPQELPLFDRLLSDSKFTVHFYNEQPFVSVLDARASLDRESRATYNRERPAESLYVADKPNNHFQYRKRRDACQSQSFANRCLTCSWLSSVLTAK